MDEERYSSDGKIHDSQRLKELQALPLWRKIQITQSRIMEWYNYYEGQVYVSFSGGKDSTVLLDLVRRVYSDVPAVFVDTGLEYPEIREFVKTKCDIVWLKPEMRFDEVIKKYGYPVISKEVSRDIAVARRKPEGKTADKFNPNSDYCKKYGIGWCLDKWNYLKNSNIPISNQCCNIMKKHPMRKYGKETNRKPFIGTMTCESQLRKKEWINNGCNAFNTKSPSSQPMSFWTEQDVLTYLKEFNIPYASIYGDIVKNKKDKLETTGVNRTGCMFCMYGCHLEKEPNKFQRLKTSHPKIYDYCINDIYFSQKDNCKEIDGELVFEETDKIIEHKGLGLGKVLDYINVPYGKEDK